MEDYNLKIIDYKNNTLTTLSKAYNVNERLIFGDLSEIKFNTMYNQYNGYGDLIYDAQGKKIESYANQFLNNENIININGNNYVIKDIKLNRNKNNEKSYEVYGIEKAIELTYKSIPILDLSPSVANPTRVDATIANLLSSKFSENEANVVSQTGNQITIDAGASATDDEYNGMYICIIDGTGQGQTFRVTDYDGTGKVVTIDSTPSTALDTSSVYRIYNFTWKVGNIDSVFLEDGGVDIKRYYKFENTNIMESLNQIADRLGGHLTYDYAFDETYNEFVNTVNLVKPNAFAGNEIRYRKNLIYSSKELESESQIYTRIFPYGENDLNINSIPTETRTDSGVTYNAHTLGQGYIENFQYYLSLGYDIDFCRKNFVNDKYVTNALYVDDQDLYDFATEKLEAESIPKAVYDISYVDLSRISDLTFESFNVGDTIRVYDEEIGLDFYATVVEKPIRWDKVEGSKVILQNYIDDLGTYFNKIISTINNL